MESGQEDLQGDKRIKQKAKKIILSLFDLNECWSLAVPCDLVLRFSRHLEASVDERSEKSRKATVMSKSNHTILDPNRPRIKCPCSNGLSTVALDCILDNCKKDGYGVVIGGRVTGSTREMEKWRLQWPRRICPSATP